MMSDCANDILKKLKTPEVIWKLSYGNWTSFLEKLKRFAAHPSSLVSLRKASLPWGSYMEYLCVWNKYIDYENVMLITYEELKENTALGAEKIATFLELNLSKEDIQGVADRSTFKSMKNSSKITHGEFGDVLFRKGGVSDWKTLFSQENSKEMDTVFKERLGGTKVGAKIKYDAYCKV